MQLSAHAPVHSAARRGVDLDEHRPFVDGTAPAVAVLMLHRTSSLVAIAVGSCLFALTPGTAHAAEPTPEAPPDAWERPLSVVGVAGSSALGAIGAAAEVTPVRVLTVSGGIGAPWFSGSAQVAVEPRLRFFVTRTVAMTAGVGVSFGSYREASPGVACFFGCSPSYTRSWDTAVWADLEAGVEGRTSGGFTWRAFGGAGRVMNPAAYTCTGSEGCNGTAPTAPHAGIALGYALPI